MSDRKTIEARTGPFLAEGEVPRDPIEQAAVAEQEQGSFDLAWKTIRDATPGFLLRHEGKTVTFAQGAFCLTFDVRHLAGLEATVAALRAMRAR